MNNRSASVTIGPLEKGARYWAKIIRAEMDVASIPLPSVVQSSRQLPGRFLTWGEDELLAGDILIEGEETLPGQPQGWEYWVSYLQDGELVEIANAGDDEKAAMKVAGVDVRYLPGTGQLAAAVRVAIGVKLGLGDMLAQAAKTREENA